MSELDDFVQEEDQFDLGGDVGIPDVDSVPPQHSVAPGEYRLRLVTCEKRKSKKTQDPMIYTVLEVTTDPDSKLITHVMMIPTSADKERTVKNRVRAIADFYRAFGIPTSGPVQLGSYVGQEAWGILTEEEDATYGMQNRLKSWVIGK